MTAGILIIRVWLEGEGDQRRLMGRISSRLDATKEEMQLAVVTGVEDVVAETRRWLEAFRQ